MALRKVEVTVAKVRESEVVTCLQDTCCVPSLIALNGYATTVFQFYATATELSWILHQLELVGCGVDYGLVVVMPVSMVKPKPLDESEGQSSIQARLPIEEVYDRVAAMSTYGFNEWLFILVAASIAAFGLIFNSTTTVISAMLLSPLMDPLVGLIFASVIRDRPLCLDAFVSFIAGSTLVLLVGFVCGLGFCYWAPELGWPTAEMTARGTYTSVISGCFIAFPSGVAVALCITNGGVNPLVGAAISASILPPVANAGILWALAAVGPQVMHGASRSGWYAELGAYSMALFGVNIFFIYIAAYGVFQLKTVTKYKDRAEFYDDIPRVALVPQEERPWNKVKRRLPDLAQRGKGQWEEEAKKRYTSADKPSQDQGVELQEVPPKRLGEGAIHSSTSLPHIAVADAIRPSIALPHIPVYHHRSRSLFVHQSPITEDEEDDL